MRDALGISFFVTCVYFGGLLASVAVAWAYFGASGFFVGLGALFLMTWRLAYVIASEMSE